MNKLKIIIFIPGRFTDNNKLLKRIEDYLQFMPEPIKKNSYTLQKKRFYFLQLKNKILFL